MDGGAERARSPTSQRPSGKKFSMNHGFLFFCQIKLKSHFITRTGNQLLMLHLSCFSKQRTQWWSSHRWNSLCLSFIKRSSSELFFAELWPRDQLAAVENFGEAWRGICQRAGGGQQQGGGSLGDWEGLAKGGRRWWKKDRNYNLKIGG